MTSLNGVEIVDVPPEERNGLEGILHESFEGWYLRHARKTLHEVGTVRAAISSGTPVGLIMTKTLGEQVGYVYYVAVAKSHRRAGVGHILLEDALRIFKEAKMEEVFASVEQENIASERLFAAEGFTRTSFAEVSRSHGPFHALNMYRMMVVVPGEVLLRKKLS